MSKQLKFKSINQLLGEHFFIPSQKIQFVKKIFTADCDYLSVSCALFTLGDFTQKVATTRLIGNLNHSTT